MKKLLLGLAAVLFILPAGVTIAMSFIGAENAATLQNYADLLFGCLVFYPLFWNSVLYAVVITLVQFIVVIPCAFGFSQAKFKGKGALFVFYIVLMMMPLQVTILPNYIGLRDLGLLDTRLGIILPAIFSPFGVVVMRQYMKGLEQSSVDAMRLETSSVIRIMLNAVVPQIKICIFAVGLFVFADCWNMLEQPLLFVKNEAYKTLPVLLANSSQYEGSILFPAVVLFMVPMLLLYGFFSNSLEKGLTLGDMR